MMITDPLHYHISGTPGYIRGLHWTAEGYALEPWQRRIAEAAFYAGQLGDSFTFPEPTEQIWEEGCHAETELPSDAQSETEVAELDPDAEGREDREADSAYNRGRDDHFCGIDSIYARQYKRSRGIE